MATFCNFQIKTYKIKLTLYTYFETGLNKSQKSPFINVPENSILPPSKGLEFLKKRPKSLYPDVQCVESALNRTSLTAGFIHINSY